MTVKSKITGTDVVVELATLEDVSEIMRWLKESVYDDYPGEPGYLTTRYGISEGYRKAMPYVEEYVRDLIKCEGGESIADIEFMAYAYAQGFEKALEISIQKNSV